MMGYRRLLALLVLSWAAFAAQGEQPRVRMETSQGTIVLALDADRAPETVANFLAYVDEGYYDGTIFHRVIKDFMIQGGGYRADFQKKPTHQPIRNEADKGLKNRRGTIAMARTRDPHSATAQFFINLKDNDFLDHRSKTPRGWGYAAFGRVVEGMDVVDAIGAIPTGPKGPFPRDVPQTTVLIEKVTRIQETTGEQHD